MTDVPSWWSDDDRLIAELGHAVREARVPESFVRAGKGAFTWRTVDAELAELRLDSWLSASEASEPTGLRDEPPGRRHGAGPRTLSFAARELSIEVEIHADAVRGQLVPAQPGTLLVRDDDGPVRDVPVDDVGWFVIEPVPARRFRLHVRTAAGSAVITDWIHPQP
ncbi:hypothetical protein [Sphaerisporangium perillae]|uniref:hypothetical protein n=1 Tax=Sphaerisporangium perillae TaxID=2935860 RepID=UPI00200D3ED2|nr:hypothetical protein [Sphaerisporangium perillae]